MILTEINAMELYQNNLKKKIVELIEEVTCSKYIGTLDLIVNCDLYILRLGLNCKDAAPISFGYQGSEEGFLAYLRREFRKRKLQNVEYTKGTLINGDSFVYHPIIDL